MTSDRVARDDLDAIRRGDPAALACVLERYWPPVVRYVRRLIEERDAAEDVAQEVFVRLWERREAWDRDGSLRALLFRLARNLAVDEIRRGSARRRAGERAPRATDPPTPYACLEREELARAVARAVDALPERRREVFVLVRYHGLSYRETADALALSPQTVANHLSLALADLRAALGPYYYERTNEPHRTLKDRPSRTA